MATDLTRTAEAGYGIGQSCSRTGRDENPGGIGLVDRGDGSGGGGGRGRGGAIATAAAASASAGTTSLLFAGTDFSSTAGCATVASFATVDPTGLDASARTDMATRDEVIPGTIERGRTTAGRADATTREARLA